MVQKKFDVEKRVDKYNVDSQMSKRWHHRKRPLVQGLDLVLHQRQDSEARGWEGGVDDVAYLVVLQMSEGMKQK
jgi:hypothetical protein